MQIIRPLNLEKVIAFVKELPRGVKVAFMRRFAKYLIGDGSHGLKHYPTYKQITRRQAYGRSFESDKQRKFVMASLRAGYNLKTGSPMEPGYPHRTGNYQRSWEMPATDDWRRVKITGKIPHAQWPDRLAQRVGWRDIPTIIQSNLSGAFRSGMAAVNAWMKSRQKGK